MSTVTFWERYLWYPLGFRGLEAEEFKKRTLAVQLTLLTMVTAIPYSLMYAWLGFPLAPRATFIYLGFSLANLLLLLLTKRYSLFTTAQLVAIILNPLMAHIAIGGFVNSSGIILSGILSPLGALLFTDARTARVYFVLFVVDILLAALWDYYYASSVPALPKGVLIASFVACMVNVSIIVFLLISNVLQKRAEAQQELQESLAHLRDTQQELIRQEKLASVGQLTKGIVDRILNPLNYVTNFSQSSDEVIDDVMGTLQKQQDTLATSTLADLLDELQALKNNSTKIQEHSASTTRILKDMQKLLKEKSQELVETDLNSFLENKTRAALRELSPDYQPHPVQLAFDFVSPAVHIGLLPFEFGQVIHDLVSNACYTLVEKSKTALGFTPQLLVSTQLADGQVVVRLRDNGKGIAAREVPKLFSPFFTTKPTSKGTGLGLFMAKDIVEIHRGTIEIDTLEGEFTEIKLTLPVPNRC